jgi:cytochrome P450
MQDTVLPLSAPIVGIDGREMHEIVVPKGTETMLSILNCNRDPALWGPDSDEWKPERFLSPLPDTVVEGSIPGIYSHL